LHIFLTFFFFLAIPYDIAYVRSNFLSNFALSLLNKVNLSISLIQSKIAKKIKVFIFV